MTDPAAVIDLGSNLTKLVVARKGSPIEVIHRDIFPTETLKNASAGFFDQKSIDKIMADVGKCVSIAKAHGCHKIFGIATSAYRTRQNGQAVIDLLNRKYETDIKIIEGNREAELIFTGALACVDPGDDFPVLIMDIGGGSTEFIIGDRSGMLWKESFPFGSTALQNEFGTGPRLSVEQIRIIYNALAEKTGSLQKACDIYKPKTLIGTTGAFESFAKMIVLQNNTGEEAISGYKFDMEKTPVLLKQLIHSGYEDRLNMPGLLKLRAGTAHIAALILDFVLARVHVKKMLLSLCDVKEGLLTEWFRKQSGISR